MLSLLYIDDEPGLLEIGKLFLESTGNFNVTTALSGETGLEQLARQDFDAVVSDYQMPGMDGISLLKNVRKSFGNVPFVLFTGRGREEVVIEAINNGVDFYLQKGGDPRAQFAELSHKVRQAVSRRRAEEALNESERRFRELADLLPQGIYETDLTGRMTYVNRLALEMSGYTKEDIGKGLNALNVIAPEDRQRASIVFRQMVEQGTRSQGSAEYKAQRKDGSTFPVSIFSSSVLQDGRVAGVRGVIMDITERKRAEEEILAANEQLAASSEELQVQYNELAVSEKRIRMSETRLKYMLGFYEYAQKSERELLGYAIEGAGIVTGSSLGYLAFVNEDESELSMYAWSRSAMAECSMQEKPIVYKTEKTGLWGEAIRQRRPVITNDYAAPNPAKKGYPDGHPRITRHMNVPVIDEGRIVLLAGVANKPSDYTENDVDELLLLMQGLWAIIKQKRAEEVRKKNEEELRLLKISADRSSDQIFWLDFQGNFLYVNDTACRDYGYSREEFSAIKIFDLNPDLTEEIWRMSVTDLRERKNQLITSRHRRRDGSIMDVEIVVVYVSQDDREYSFAYVRDITGRKRTEEDLFNSQQMLQMVLDTIPQRVFWKDRNSVYLGCNLPLAKDAGYNDPGELTGKDDYDTASKTTADLYRADDRQVMETGQPRINYEEPQIKPDGSKAWLRTTKVPLLNKEGKIIGVLGTYEDITERKRAEEALFESEEKYRSLVESSFDGIAIHQDGILVYVNQTAARLLGTDDPGRFIGKPAIDIVAPEFRARITERVQRAPESPQELIQEQFLRIDGTAIDVDVTTTPCTWKGKTAAYITFRDISAQVRAETALRESEEKYRMLVETTSDFIWEVNAEGVYTYASPQARRILGYEPEELLGKTPFDIMSPDEARRVGAEFSRYVESRLPITALENKVLRKDGSVVTLETSGVILIGKDGGYHGYRGIDRDITERKRAEKLLRLLSRMDQEALRAARMGHFEFDVASQTFLFNDQYYAMIGTTADKAGGYRIPAQDFAQRFVYPDDAHFVEETIREAIGTQDPRFQKQFESRIIRPDGSVMWVGVWFRIEKDTIGKTIRFYGVNQDITDRKRAEQAQKEREEWGRTILNTAQAGIILVDAETHRILDANCKALDLIGLPQDAVTGAVCHRFICPAEKGKCPVTDCGQTVDTSERVLLTAAGMRLPVLKTVVPTSIGGRNVLVESFVDISEQKRSEAAVREANRKLNLLNSITRHDIRNQLMVAQGYTQLATLNKPDPVVADFLTKISTAVQIIQHQIEFTKEYQELGVHAPVWFPADEVILSVRPEKIALRNTCTAIEIFADPMIDRVFFNLFDNAAKHGNGVTAVTVGCRETQNGLVITFADNGSGITPGEKQKIFEKGHGKNTGLGLFLAREILAITGITINETGIPGQGAVFEITVPEGAYRKTE
jgi:PAS domain S-box-containing protein